MHHGQGTGLEFPDIPQVHLIGKAGKENAVRNQPRKGRFSGARQDEEQAGRQGQDRERDHGGMQGEAQVEAFRSAARGHAGPVNRPPYFAGSERRNREQQVQREEDEEIEIDGENRRRQQFQKGDDRCIQIVAIALGGQDLHHGQEEQQMHGGRKEIP